MTDEFILAINAGSSSLKFALFRAGEALLRTFWGKFERIGTANATLTVNEPSTGNGDASAIQTCDHFACVPLLVECLEENISLDRSGCASRGNKI
jgi:acetate kinase